MMTTKTNFSTGTLGSIASPFWTAWNWRRIALATLVAATLLASLTFGQGMPPAGDRGNAGVRQTNNEPATGSITGVVFGDNGQPLADAVVALAAVSTNGSADPGQTTAAKPDGCFRFDNLRAQTYMIQSFKPGYVLPESADLPSNRPRYRIGANVVLTMFRGGVITGTVTDSSGAPMIAAPVRAVRVRDSDGRKLQFVVQGASGRSDDRGIYRFYGLPTGSYVVSAGMVQGRRNDFAGVDEANDAAPTYYPSSAAEGATEVLVGYGQEVSGIDIRARSEAGRTISGVITGNIRGPEARSSAPTVTLFRTANGVIAGSASALERNGEFSFSLANVPDGEYELKADRWQPNGGAASAPFHLTVKGNDIGGVVLELAALGSIGGRLVLEADAVLKDRPECSSTTRPAVAEEFSFRLRRDNDAKTEELENAIYTRESAVDDGGKFAVRNLRGGTYRFQFTFPDERYYLRSLTKLDPAGKGADLNQTGVNLGAGENMNGVSIKFSDGAAGVKGRIALSNPGATLRGRMLFHLIPAEPESSNDSLRYRDVEVEADGFFAIANLAPGKYWLYAEPLPVTDTRAFFRRPAAWDTATRLKLRRAAEAAKITLELQPCQRLTDFVFRFTPVATSQNRER